MHPSMPKFLFYNKRKGTYRLHDLKTDDKRVQTTKIKADKIAQLAASLDEETLDKLIEFLDELKRLRQKV